MSDIQTVTVSILDREYQVSCKAEEVADLKQSASHLDQKMREVKQAGSVLGLDRIAVMTALNIANEYLLEVRRKSDVVKRQGQEIEFLSKKLDKALGRLKAQV